jgi:hypothetical protein
MASDENAFPGTASYLRDVVRGARSAWRPTHLVLAWLAVLPLFAIERFWLPPRESAGGLGQWLLALVVLAALGAAIGLLGAIAGSEGWSFGRDYRMRLGEVCKLLVAQGPRVFLAAISVPVLALATLGILVGGSFVLGSLPLGHVWSLIWVIAIGVPIALVAAVLVVLGLSAVPLMMAAACLDCREAFETLTRAVSYVRARPLKAAAGYAAAVGAAALAAATLALVLSVLTGFLTLAHGIGGSREPLDASLAALGLELRGADFLWPLPASALGWLGAALEGLRASAPGAQEEIGARAWLFPGVFLGRWVSAAFLAGFAGGLARVYLHLRWELDREPPSALVLQWETFDWERQAAPSGAADPAAVHGPPAPAP